MMNLIIAFVAHLVVGIFQLPFTTFLVFWVLVYDDATTANIEYRFNEQVFDTLLGISLPTSLVS
jgi:hypothetical protein